MGNFLYSQFVKSYGLPHPGSSFAGKTIVITGGNSGLGKEAARHYCRLGASKVVLAVRNLDKGHDAKHDIEHTTGCGHGVIEVWKLDMASYANVQKFVRRIDKDLDRIDIFHANAGVANSEYSKWPESTRRRAPN